MRRLVSLLASAPLVFGGCVSMAPQEAPPVRLASPRQAANIFYYRQTTVETCDGRTLHGQIFTSRGDSLDLRPSARVAWSDIRSMSASKGRSPDRAAAVLAGGTLLTALAGGLVYATGEPCGMGCDSDERSLDAVAAFGLGGVLTLFAAVVTLGGTPTRTLRYGFDCPATAPRE